MLVLMKGSQTSAAQKYRFELVVLLNCLDVKFVEYCLCQKICHHRREADDLRTFESLFEGHEKDVASAANVVIKLEATLFMRAEVLEDDLATDLVEHFMSLLYMTQGNIVASEAHSSVEQSFVVRLLRDDFNSAHSDSTNCFCNRLFGPLPFVEADQLPKVSQGSWRRLAWIPMVCMRESLTLMGAAVNRPSVLELLSQ